MPFSYIMSKAINKEDFYFHRLNIGWFNNFYGNSTLLLLTVKQQINRILIWIASKKTVKNGFRRRRFFSINHTRRRKYNAKTILFFAIRS